MTRRRETDAGGGLGLLDLPQQRAFHDVAYGLFRDAHYEMMKDPDWRKMVQRHTEEFLETALRIVRKQRNKRAKSLR
jgi:hypothetical protein